MLPSSFLCSRELFHHPLSSIGGDCLEGKSGLSCILTFRYLSVLVLKKRRCPTVRVGGISLMMTVRNAGVIYPASCISVNVSVNVNANVHIIPPMNNYKGTQEVICITVNVFHLCKYPRLTLIPKKTFATAHCISCSSCSTCSELGRLP